MRDLKRLREKEEKLKNKLRELQEQKRELRKLTEGKLLVSQLIPYLVLPLQNCLINLDAESCLRLILLYRCNKGKAVKNLKACLEGLKEKLSRLKEHTASYPQVAKRVAFTIQLLDLVLKLPEEKIVKIAKEVSAIPYPERVLKVAEEVLASKSSSKL